MNISHSSELRSLFLKFFESKGHAVIPSASVIPENDPTVLFTTAGMHPLVPYLLGAKHPMGTRLTDVQKCIRTGDIEDVGDSSHLTFFEMLGNWSLGDYFKKEAIAWSWEFLTSPEWLGLDPERLAFSVFAGDETVPRDDEAANLWREQAYRRRHLLLPAGTTEWAPAGTTGPAAGFSEKCSSSRHGTLGPDCSPACRLRQVSENLNDECSSVQQSRRRHLRAARPENVDTGMGLERTSAS
jgi:alanyl-tRNA synthetase